MSGNIIDFEYERTKRNIILGKLATKLPEPPGALRPMPVIDPEKVFLLVSLLTELLEYAEQIRH